MLKIKWYAPLIAVALFATLMFATQVTVQASPPHGFGQGQGREDIPNENDFHTAEWERFFFNYIFTSGPDHRVVLGQPTQFTGFVPVDVFTANFRSDAMVSLWPPSYGIFSGNIPTDPTSWFFTQPLNPNFAFNMAWDCPNTLALFDTLMQGVNAQNNASDPFSTNTGNGQWLPPTSI